MGMGFTTDDEWKRFLPHSKISKKDTRPEIKKQININDDLLLYAYNLGRQDEKCNLKTTSNQILKRIKKKIV